VSRTKKKKKKKKKKKNMRDWKYELDENAARRKDRTKQQRCARERSGDRIAMEHTMMRWMEIVSACAC
jgi:hypothetical protein